MTKDELRALVESFGDAIINYKSANSGKAKYNVCTLDFDCAHIQRKTNRAVEDADTLLFFCWDTDSFRLLRPSNVTKVIPLSSILNNEDI